MSAGARTYRVRAQSVSEPLGICRKSALKVNFCCIMGTRCWRGGLEHEVLDYPPVGTDRDRCTYNGDEIRIVVKDNTDDPKHL
jgi:hypothetical protein